MDTSETEPERMAYRVIIKKNGMKYANEPKQNKTEEITTLEIRFVMK